MRLIAILCALIGFSLPAGATCTVARQTTIPATFAHGKVFVPVQINEATALFMVDTGSDETLVNAAFAAKAGVAMDRHAPRQIFAGAGNKDTLPVQDGHVRMTHVGDIHYQDWEYGIVDLPDFGLEGQPLGGILGMDFLHYFDLEIDAPARTLSIYRLTGCTQIHPPSWSGDYAAIPLKHTASHNLTLPVFLDNADLDMTFDTGASGILVSRDAASRAGVTPAALARDAASQGRGMGGGFAVATHRFSLLLIGEGVYSNVDLRVENEYSRRGETDGLVGLAAFKAPRVWISFLTNTLFVQGAPKK